MAHSTVFNHRKLIRLAKLLQVSRACALGHLEFLWHYVADHHLDGNISALTDAEIEAVSDWDGSPGAFVGACCDSGFIDRVIDGSELMAGACRSRIMRVHDWLDWAPDYVKKRLARAGLRKTTADNGALTEPRGAETRPTEPDPEEPRRTEPRTHKSARATETTAADDRDGSEPVPDAVSHARGTTDSVEYERFRRMQNAFSSAVRLATLGNEREAAREFATSITGLLKLDANDRDRADCIALAMMLCGKAKDRHEWVRSMRACHKTALAKAETGGRYGAWRVAVERQFGKWSVRT